MCLRVCVCVRIVTVSGLTHALYRQICTLLDTRCVQTVPQSFTSVLREHVRQGYRVLACAQRKLVGVAPAEVHSLGRYVRRSVVWCGVVCRSVVGVWDVCIV